MLLSSLFCFFYFLVTPLSAYNDIRDHSLLEGPGPLFSIGHNILTKNELILDEELLYIKITPDNSSLINFNSVYYGITNRLSAVIIIPTILKDVDVQNARSKGLSNIIAQLEYAFYEHKEIDAIIQYTIIGNIFFPTTQVVKNFDLFDTKSPTFFLGLTTNNLSTVWYTYSDIGIFFTTKRRNFKLGNRIWYDIGFGRNFFERNKFSCAGLLEMSGIYERPDTINKKKFLKTGGNRLYFGPSLRFDYGGLVVIGGFQYVISDVSREDVSFKYRSIISLSYVFN